MKVRDEEVLYELKNAVQESHLPVAYVNRAVSSEEDVDNEFSSKEPQMLVVRDSFGEDRTFIKK
ncbi:MAG: hypothetical protein IJJ25_07625 [Lachnospiraceae bacterium]|nr:hypothetical protein [Lachnospiraceae bacterium]